MTTTHDINPAGRNPEIEDVRTGIKDLADKQAEMQHVREQWRESHERLRSNDPDGVQLPGQLPQRSAAAVFGDLGQWKLDPVKVEAGEYVDRVPEDLAGLWSKYSAVDLSSAVLGNNPEPLAPIAQLPRAERKAAFGVFQEYTKDRMFYESFIRHALRKSRGEDFVDQLIDEGGEFKYLHHGIDSFVDTVIMEDLLHLRENMGGNLDASTLRIAEDALEKTGLVSKENMDQHKQTLRAHGLNFMYRLRGMNNPTAMAVATGIGTAVGFITPVGAPAMMIRAGAKTAQVGMRVGAKIANKFITNPGKVLSFGAKWGQKLKLARAVEIGAGGALYEGALGHSPVAGATGFLAAHGATSVVDAITSKWLPSNMVAHTMSEVFKGATVGGVMAHMPFLSEPVMRGTGGDGDQTMLDLAIKAIRHEISDTEPLTAQEKEVYQAALGSSVATFATFGLAKAASNYARFSRLQMKGATLDSLNELSPPQRKALLKNLNELMEVKFFKTGDKALEKLTPEQRKSAFLTEDGGFLVVNKKGEVANFEDFATSEGVATARLHVNKVLTEALMAKDANKIHMFSDSLIKMGSDMGGTMGARTKAIGQYLGKAAGKLSLIEGEKPSLWETLGHKFKRGHKASIFGILSRPIKRSVITKGQAKKVANTVTRKLTEALGGEPSGRTAKPARLTTTSSNPKAESAPTRGVPWDVAPTGKEMPAPRDYQSKHGWTFRASNHPGGVRELVVRYAEKPEKLENGTIRLQISEDGLTAVIERPDKSVTLGTAPNMTAMVQLIQGKIAEGTQDKALSETFGEAMWDFHDPGVRGNHTANEWLTGLSYGEPNTDDIGLRRAADQAAEAAPQIAMTPEGEKVVEQLRTAAQVTQDEPTQQHLEGAADYMEMMGMEGVEHAQQLDTAPTSIDNLQDALERQMAHHPADQRYWKATYSDSKGWVIEPADSTTADIDLSRADLRQGPERIRQALEIPSLKASGELMDLLGDEAAGVTGVEIVDPVAAGILSTETVAPLYQAIAKAGASPEFSSALLSLTRRVGSNMRPDTAILLSRELSLGQDPALGLSKFKDRALIAFSEEVYSPDSKMGDMDMFRTMLHEFIHHHTNSLPAMERQQVLESVGRLNGIEKDVDNFEQLAEIGAEMILSGATTGQVKSVVPPKNWKNRGLQYYDLGDAETVTSWLNNASAAIQIGMNEITDTLANMGKRNTSILGESLLGSPQFSGVSRSLFESLVERQQDQTPMESTGGRTISKGDLQNWLTVAKTLHEFLNPVDSKHRDYEAEAGYLASVLGGPPVEKMVADIGKTKMPLKIKKEVIQDLTAPLDNIKQKLGREMGVVNYQERAYGSLEEFFTSPWRKKLMKAFALDPRKAPYLQTLKDEMQVYERLKAQGWVDFVRKAEKLDPVAAAQLFLESMGIQEFIGGNAKTMLALSLPLCACDPSIGPNSCAGTCYVCALLSNAGPTYNRQNINNDAKIVSRIKLQEILNTNPDGAAIATAMSFLYKSTADALKTMHSGDYQLSPKMVKDLGKFVGLWLEGLKRAMASPSGVFEDGSKIKANLQMIPGDMIRKALMKGPHKAAQAFEMQQELKEKVKGLEARINDLKAVKGKMTVKRRKEIDALNQKIVDTKDATNRNIDELIEGFNQAQSGHAKGEGWSTYLRVYDAGDLMNMQSVRWVNTLAGLLEPFKVEVQLFTRRPELGQYVVNRNAFIINSLDPDPSTIQKGSKSTLPKCFLMSSTDPAVYDKALSHYKHMCRLNGIKKPMDLIVTLFPPDTVVKNAEAFDKILKVFEKHGMKDAKDKICPCDANYNPLQASCLSCRLVGKRCMGDTMRHVKTVHDGDVKVVQRRQGFSGPDGLATMDFEAHPKTPYRADLYQYAAEDLPGEMWPAVFTKVRADELGAQDMLGAIVRLQDIHKQMPLFQQAAAIDKKKAVAEHELVGTTKTKHRGTSLPEAKKTSKAKFWGAIWPEMLGSQEYSWGLAGADKFVLSAEVRAMEEVDQQLGPQGLAGWLNTMRLVSGHVTEGMQRETKLWGMDAPIAKRFAKALKSGGDFVADVAGMVERRTKPAERHELFNLGVWLGTPFWSEREQGENLPPMQRLINVAGKILDAKQLISQGKSAEAYGMLEEAKAVMQEGTDLRHLMEGRPLYEEIGKAFKGLQKAHYDGETQADRHYHAMANKGPAEDSIPGLVGQINEALRHGVRRAPQSLIKAVSNLSASDASWLSYADLTDGVVLGAWNRFKNQMLEPSHIFGEDLVLPVADAQNKSSRRTHEAQQLLYTDRPVKTGPFAGLEPGAFHKLKKTVEARLVFWGNDEMVMDEISGLLDTGTKKLSLGDIQNYLADAGLTHLAEDLEGLKVKGLTPYDLRTRIKSFNAMMEACREYFFANSPVLRAYQREEQGLLDRQDRLRADWDEMTAELRAMGVGPQQARSRLEKLGDEQVSDNDQLRQLQTQLETEMVNLGRHHPLIIKAKNNVGSVKRRIKTALNKLEKYKQGREAAKEARGKRSEKQDSYDQGREKRKLTALEVDVRDGQKALEDAERELSRVSHRAQMTHPRLQGLRHDVDALLSKMKGRATSIAEWAPKVAAVEQDLGTVFVKEKAQSFIDKAKELTQVVRLLEKTREKVDEYLVNWGLQYYAPHLFNDMGIEPGKFRGMKGRIAMKLLGPRAARVVSNMRTGKSSQGRQSTFPTQVGFRFGKQRTGKHGWENDPWVALPVYLQALFQSGEMNAALEKISPLVLGTLVPIARAGVVGETGYDEEAGAYNKRVIYRHHPARILQKVDDRYEIQVEGMDPSWIWGDQLAHLKVRKQGLQAMMESPYKWRDFENWVDKNILHKREKTTILNELNELAGEKVRGFFYHTMLGLGNLKSPFNNAIGGLSMLMTEVGPVHLARGIKWVLKNPVKSIRQAQEAGILESRMTAEMSGHGIESIRNVGDLLRTVSFLPFQSVEAVLRVLAYATGVQRGVTEGEKADDRLHMHGLQVVGRSQFLFSPAMTPELFGNSGGIAGAKTFLHLWQYAVRFEGQMGRWFREGAKTGDWSRLTRWGMMAWAMPHYFRKLTGIDMRDTFSTSVEEIPLLGNVGRVLQDTVGYKPDWPANNILPILTPFDMRSVPIKVILDALWASLQSISGDDPQHTTRAWKQFVAMNRKALVGRNPNIAFDLASMGKNKKGDVTLSYPEGVSITEYLEEMIGMKERTGPLAKKGSFFDLVYSMFGPGQLDAENVMWWAKDRLKTLKEKEVYSKRILGGLLDSAIRKSAYDKPGGMMRFREAFDFAKRNSIGMPEFKTIMSKKRWVSMDYPYLRNALLAGRRPATQFMTELMAYDMTSSTTVLSKEQVKVFEMFQHASTPDKSGMARPSKKLQEFLKTPVYAEYRATRKAWEEFQNGER